nr:hypothetical protein [Candidatus Freyarchaeota archaeon]
MSKFPFLEDKTIIGKFISIYTDGRVKRIDKEIKFKPHRRGNTFYAEILEPNPLKNTGIPLPSYILVNVFKYEEKYALEVKEFPIAENMLLKASSSYFEDEMKKF